MISREQNELTSDTWKLICYSMLEKSWMGPICQMNTIGRTDMLGGAGHAQCVADQVAQRGTSGDQVYGH